MSGKRDLNPRPSPWQGDALPLSYSREDACGYSDANLDRQARDPSVGRACDVSQQAPPVPSRFATATERPELDAFPRPLDRRERSSSATFLLESLPARNALLQRSTCSSL